MSATPTTELLLGLPDSLTETFPGPPPPQVPAPLHSAHQSQMALGVHGHSPSRVWVPGADPAHLGHSAQCLLNGRVNCRPAQEPDASSSPQTP